MSKHCIWLTIESSEVHDIILELANRYNSPMFQPHCTLIGRTEIPVYKLKSSIIKIYDSISISDLHIKRIRYSEDIWKSLYLEIKEKQILTELHKTICDLISIDYDKIFIPHISLMYAKVSVEDKKNIILPLKIDEPFLVKSIQITECNGDVDSWKPVFELKV